MGLCGGVYSQQGMTHHINGLHMSAVQRDFHWENSFHHDFIQYRLFIPFKCMC